VFAANQKVILAWESVGQLAPNEYYVPTVAYLRGSETWYDETPWIKEARWEVSEHRYLLDLADGGQFRWAVQVMQRTGVDAKTGKPIGVPASPLSEVRALTWQRSGGGGGPEPTPFPPDPGPTPPSGPPPP